MDFNQFLKTANLVIFLSWAIKLFAITASIFYLFFSLVVLKQVEIMKKTVQINDHGLLRLTALIQLLVSSLLIFYSLFIL